MLPCSYESPQSENRSTHTGQYAHIQLDTRSSRVIERKTDEQTDRERETYIQTDRERERYRETEIAHRSI